MKSQNANANVLVFVGCTKLNRLPAERMQPKSRHQLVRPFQKHTMFVTNPCSKCEHALDSFDRHRLVDLMQPIHVMDERPFYGRVSVYESVCGNESK